MSKHKQDREAMNVLAYLVLKLGKTGIPVTKEEWDTYRKHVEQINRTIKDSDNKFAVGDKVYSVSNSWLKYAHNFLYVAEKYFSDARKEITEKGGAKDE